MAPTISRAAALGAMLCAAPRASAQDAPRLRADLEVGVTGIASVPQRDQFGVGVTAGARLRVRALGPIGVHAVFATHGFSPLAPNSGWGSLLTAGVGVHVAPQISSGALLLDAEALLFPAQGGNVGAAFGVGLGYLVRATPWLDAGPVVRASFGQVMFAPAGGATDDVASWSASLALSFHPGAAVARPRDSDGDGLLDDRDACPAEAEDLDGFRDADGCPDPDNDGDGLRDPLDRCPVLQEDRDGFDDSDGCPDPDNDGDGVPDARDACISEAEDPDGQHDDDGCPDDDDDGDGVRDGDDRCLTQPETRNGFLDDDGCPDTDPPQATVLPGRVELSRPVTFESGTSRLRATDRALLDVIARLLHDRPDLNNVRLDVTASELPLRGANIDLARERGRVALRYLASQGVNPLRLSILDAVRGPSPAGARVEFVIIAGPWALRAAP